MDIPSLMTIGSGKYKNLGVERSVFFSCFSIHIMQRNQQDMSHITVKKRSELVKEKRCNNEVKNIYP